MTEDARVYLTDDFLNKWKEIFSTVEIKNLPLEYISCLIIKLSNGEEYVINVAELLDNDISSAELENILELKFEDLGEDLLSVDYMLNLEKVSEEIQKETDKTLRNL